MRSHPPLISVLFAVAVVGAELTSGGVAPAAAQAPEAPPGAAPVSYGSPVAAPVVDGFRPPATPYGAGNLGLEYATEGGEEVRAAAAGVVVFAGEVGRERFVTILHDDRVRTTYGRLRGIDVRRGQVVAAGRAVGAAGPRFIWTARLGSAYLDPSVLLAASGRGPVRLVPNRVGEPVRPVPPPPVAAAAARWALE